MQIRNSSTCKILALFALAGPPIGAFAMLLWRYFAANPPLPFKPREWLAIVFLLAYVYGALPALASGYSAALIRKAANDFTPAHRVFRFVVPVLVGALCSALFLPAIAPEVSAIFAAGGAFAAFVCTALVEWLTRVRPNKSFKPNPLRGSA